MIGNVWLCCHYKMQKTKYKRISSESSDESEDEHVPSIMKYWETIRPSSTDDDSESGDDFSNNKCNDVRNFETPKHFDIINVENNAENPVEQFQINALSSEPSDNLETKTVLKLLVCVATVIFLIFLFSSNGMVTLAQETEISKSHSEISWIEFEGN